MKKIIYSAAVLFFSITSLFAEVDLGYDTNDYSDEDVFHLSVAPFCGLKNGILGEYVFIDNYNYNHKLSYLEWEIKNEIVLGSNVNLSLKRFNLSGHFNIGIPEDSGIVKDSDWFNTDPRYVTSTSGYNYKTHYSEHENEIDYDFSLGFLAGFDFNPVSSLILKPLAGMDFSRTKFTAHGGWNLHGPGKGDPTSYYTPYTSATLYYYGANTLVLEYFREQVVTWAGFGAQYTFNPFNYKLILSSNILISPYTHTFNKDHHPTSSVYYVDVCNGFFSAFSLEQSVEFVFNKYISVVLNGNFTKVFTIEGTNYQSSNDTDWSKTSNGTGGADSQTYTVNLSVKYSIF